MAVEDTVLRRVGFHIAVGKAHREIGVRVGRLALLPFKKTCRKSLGTLFDITQAGRILGIAPQVNLNDCIVHPDGRVFGEFHNVLVPQCLNFLCIGKGAAVEKVVHKCLCIWSGPVKAFKCRKVGRLGILRIKIQHCDCNLPFESLVIVLEKRKSAVDCL